MLGTDLPEWRKRNRFTQDTLRMALGLGSGRPSSRGRSPPTSCPVWWSSHCWLWSICRTNGRWTDIAIRPLITRYSGRGPSF